MKKTILGIIIGIVLSLGVKTAYANYEYVRLKVVESFSLYGGGSPEVFVFWDDAEKTNCYVFSSHNHGGISCIRSMNY